MTDVFAFGTLDHWVCLKIILWFFIKPYCLIKPKIQMSDRNKTQTRSSWKNDRKLTWSLQMSSFKYPEIWLVDWFDQLGFPAIAEMRQQAAIALGLVIKNSSSKLWKFNYYKQKWIFIGEKNLKNAKIWNGFDNPRDNRSTLDLNYFVSNYNFLKKFLNFKLKVRERTFIPLMD